MKIWKKWSRTTHRLDGESKWRIVWALNELSFVWLKRIVVRLIGETTYRLDCLSSPWEGDRSRVCSWARWQTTCRFPGFRTTCRPCTQKPESHLTKRRRFEQAKRRRFAATSRPLPTFFLLLLRSTFNHFIRISLSLLSLSLDSLSLPPLSLRRRPAHSLEVISVSSLLFWWPF